MDHAARTLDILDPSAACILVMCVGCWGGTDQIARTAEHSRTGKSIPKGVITQFEIAEAKKDEEIEKVRITR